MIRQAAFTHGTKLLKGALHCHTTRSDGAGTPEETIRYHAQHDYDFMALTGCGPTCLAMVAESRGETKWNPWRVAKMAQRNGYYVDGQGSAWSLMTEGAAKMGLNGTEMSCDAETIRRTLEDGHVIICAMRPGDFTTAGHFLVLAGVTQDGEVIINDPNSRKNSRRTWDLERVVPQIKNLWAYTA